MLIKFCSLFCFIIFALEAVAAEPDCSVVLNDAYQMPPSHDFQDITVTNAETGEKNSSSTDIYCDENEKLLSTADNAAMELSSDRLKIEFQPEKIKIDFQGYQP